MRRLKKIFVLGLGCFCVNFCDAIHSLRSKKLSVLPPLTSAQLGEVVQKLKVANNLECAFVFNLKTTTGKKSETIGGKFYSQQNSDGMNLRFNLGNQSFLFLGNSNGEILCSEKLKKITSADPLQPGHLLNFADILMPFLDYKTYEYRNSKRVQGRNTHIIRFKELAGQSIDIAYDPAYEAILRVEYFDEKEKLIRTFKLLNFKKSQHTWLMKSIEIEDVSNKITTQLTIEKVVVEQILPPMIFDKNSLEKNFVDPLVYAAF
ncbi:MAG: outer membrane lipoprotein-sorting protein [Puniceicoccales bacterium]|jgi:hypothetical protein|nr:outer membrane lipoprotein-sorting protein [Puniceicoccales bacterium]